MTLVLVLMFSLLPATGGAARISQDRAEQIKEDVRKIYDECRRQSGKYSFSGWCGALVSWELYVMGITAELQGADGKDHYDNFKNLEYSSGGYRVRAYPGVEYSLEESINLITANGTQDAYNILVGFERTNTYAGRIYGHALMINAIVDGMVYFCESYATPLNGAFYPEGSPIACSIADFCKYYSRWNEVDGVIHFGLKTYAESCVSFPAYLDAGVLQETPLYSSPCDTETDDRSQPLRTLQIGERLNVIGLYKNTEGEYWYQVKDTKDGFVRAERTQVLAMRYDDVTVDSIDAPAELWQGRGFDIKGKLRSNYNEIYTVRAQVFTLTGETPVYVMSTTHNLDGRSYSLSRTLLSEELAFRKLTEGTYRYELAVVVGNYYFADGCLQTEWKTIKLWRSNFRVVTVGGGTCSITFDPNGGQADLNAADVLRGESLSSMPQAKRDGYVFGGWFTEDGVEVTSDTVITENMKLQAKWLKAEDVTGWYIENGNWIYLENGEKKTGFVRIDGISYHINEEGSLDVGWQKIDGRLYYFNGNGAMYTGWLEGEEGMYYFTATGAATGWMYIDDVRYYFDENGILQE